MSNITEVSNRSERGWVIETAAGDYWNGRSVTAKGFGNINDSIRFVRFQDAEVVRCYLLTEFGWALRCSEHIWAVLEKTKHE